MSDRNDLRNLHDLVGRLFDGEVSNDDFDHLQFVLRDDPAARLAYHEFCTLHSELAERHGGGVDLLPFIDTQFVTDAATGHAASQAGSSTSRLPVEPVARSGISLAVTLALALSACLLGVLLGHFSSSSRFAPSGQSALSVVAAASEQARSVATITGGVAPQFDSNTRDGEIKIGQRVAPGRMRLERGIAEVVFDCGAAVIINGPAEIDIVDDSSLYLMSGSLSADVGPDASQFVIRTSAYQVVELDAEFGLHVGPERATKFHVFRGEIQVVDFVDPARPERNLAAGQAMEIDATGQAVTVESNETPAFVTHGDLDRLERGVGKRAREAWQLYSHRWLSDPKAIARYDFSPSEGGLIRNTLDSDQHTARSLQQYPRWIDGRWDGKSCMLFDGRTDLLTVPDHPDLQLSGHFSVAAWVRVRSMPQHSWARIVGKGTGTERNYGIWLNNDGSLLWQVCPQTAPRSQMEWDRVSLNSETIPVDKWTHVVGIVDGESMQLYVNGSLHVARRAPPNMATSSAPLTIGYYEDVPYHNDHFDGEIDELILLRRALSADEIHEMYEVGRPDKDMNESELQRPEQASYLSI